jgi:hypothetical protein
MQLANGGLHRVFKQRNHTRDERKVNKRRMKEEGKQGKYERDISVDIPLYFYLRLIRNQKCDSRLSKLFVLRLLEDL